MQRLEHVNLVVKDIAATADFLMTAFPDWRVRGTGTQTWHGKPRHWSHIGDDDTYITLNDNGEGENRDLAGHNPGLAHIGFEVDDLDAVLARLLGAGYEIDIDGFDHPFRRNVYFVDPAGFQFEFIQYLSEKPEEKNRYD
ncbi:MAG: VOC family protein [Alphaproteobacteria bacterium]|jgi:catechol 2,3-dioxygenase-like lactoylglutathione lyase family enzyme|nr:VOC family protein [Alphaproteobacteria bacterium]MBO6863128.1 VOC family protein [Alphaproteobacteria bacterium]